MKKRLAIGHFFLVRVVVLLLHVLSWGFCLTRTVMTVTPSAMRVSTASARVTGLWAGRGRGGNKKNSISDLEDTRPRPNPTIYSRKRYCAILRHLYLCITAGWQANPVEFDHLLKRSTAAWAMGSPDIVPLFTDAPHIRGASYAPHLQVSERAGCVCVCVERTAGNAQC